MTLRRSLLSLAVLCALVPPAQAGTSVYFSPNGGGAAAVAARIDKAQDSVDVAMYSVSTNNDAPIFAALKRAIDERNVRVRIILKDRNKAKSVGPRLAELGCHVFYTTSTLHQKFSIIDAKSWSRRTLTNGSANWSLGADTTYSENTVIYDGWRYHRVIKAFQDEFNHLLSIAKPFSENADQHVDPVDFWTWDSGPNPVEALFTSANTGAGSYTAEGVVNGRIAAEIRNAKRSVIIDVAHFDSIPIGKALMEAYRASLEAERADALNQAIPEADKRKRLEVQVLLDQGELAPGKYSQARALEAAGIEVRYKYYSLTLHRSNWQLMHHKTAIIDREILISGSYNFSKTAEFSNYENAIVTREPALVSAFIGEHEKLWSKGRDLLEPLKEVLFAPKGSAKYQRYVPVHFNTDYFDATLTLTRDEIAPIYDRFSYYQGFDKKRTARIWDRETDEELKRPSGKSFDGFIAELIAEHGTFLEPKAGGAGAGLSGSLQQH